uniref:Peptidase C1A papain C-terminal domain-containing protein n=1 Tax=Chromera velia CCMP2878 TaxID=1169474 RepID=A0A0G4HYH5_9ALVE|eukprot:Cvel_9490.t1-p1 / transcript=Cvel_9490.t1 / gene=Cvel_9490 / organism=Chromera_velia_CCMP2878 / gene_product=Cathepsin L, putative / transcript_product=Cathepsin L, putative / location=Cvel_scaffold548:44244-47940(+) / protein_length=382 / sequence_SO=supercontig / SO=protein_coding / is_pseudo=false
MPVSITKTVSVVGGLAVLMAGGGFLFFRHEKDQAAGTPGTLSDEEVRSAFEEFALTHQREYKSDLERKLRLEIFRSNLEYIKARNAQNLNFKLAVNQFADMKEEEVLGTGGCLRDFLGSAQIETAEELRGRDPSEFPETFDWSEAGCVTPVKNQGQCGSCWAFSTTGAVEGALCVAGKETTPLSEQELVDCSGKYGNLGCNGGTMDRALQYIQDNGGICTEASYPYIARKSWIKGCQAKKCKRGATIESWKQVPEDDEGAMLAALHDHGPLSVALDAEGRDFMYYHSGVLDGKCGTELDHAVLITGYGNDAKSGEDYWLVKNSWGKTWGDKGYLKVFRNKGKEGECGIAMEPFYAVVKKEKQETDAVEEIQRLSEALFPEEI